MPGTQVQVRNNLYPVFLKLDELKVLVVGGGKVGLEKLHSLLTHAPDACITLVAIQIDPAIKAIAQQNEKLKLMERPFETSDLEGHHLIIIAVNDIETSTNIKAEAQAKGILANVADKPALCDFYLSSIVSKGNLKIGISTNGKSPTMAKRLKEILNEAIPNEVEESLHNLELIRKRLNGSFADKLKKLNEITSVLINPDKNTGESEKKVKRLATRLVLAFALMVTGHLLISAIPLAGIWQSMQVYFTWQMGLFVVAGFLAQLVDGLLGMGYGVTAATSLMMAGVPPVSVSASIHTTEVFSAAVNGYSHYKFGNVNKKLLRHLVWPGVIGAILGALFLVFLGNIGEAWLMPILAAYAMFLGIKILIKAFAQNPKRKKIKRLGWLAGVGGFLDSFGGGGWGPLVTSSLIAKGRSPRFTIGSVSLSEFFITLASAFTFYFASGLGHWPIVMALLVGGILAAPIASRMVGKLPPKTLMKGVGGMVIIWSLWLIVKSVFW